MMMIVLFLPPHKFACLWLKPWNRDGDKATIVRVTIDTGNRAHHTGHSSKFDPASSDNKDNHKTRTSRHVSYWLKKVESELQD